MPSEGDEESRGKRHAGGELILPAAAVLFAIYYFSTILDSPWEARFAAYFVGTVLFLLTGIFVLKTALEVRAGAADLGFGDLFAWTPLARKRVALLALTIGYIFLIDWLGFTITSFLFLSLAMLVLDEHRRAKLILPLAACISLAGYLLFVVAFETRFPDGPFEAFIEGLF
jgi:hypothetical protein